jgi:hypothetical protein
MLIALAALMFVFVTANSLRAETVFLKDGSIVECEIISDAAGTITVKMKDKTRKTISRANIMRILYTEIYMGKIYVQMISGKNFVCYQVDEDRNTYTFRNNINNPEEFTVKREDVLFIARGNPSGLDGEADFISVNLKWFAPYNEVKKYRVYAKAPGDKEFVMLAEFTSKTGIVKELKSNTKYVFRVTAIDSLGDESLPSNELTLATKNMPPVAPEIDPINKLPNGGYHITWKGSSDIDGKVAGYRVYRMLDGKSELFYEGDKTEYDLEAAVEFDRIDVVAFDDLKTESAKARVYFEYKPETMASARIAFLYPFGKLKKMASFGTGVSARYEMANHFWKRFECGGELSFFYLKGKRSGFPEKESKVNSVYLAPLALYAGYAVYPTKNLALIPTLSLGAMFMRYDYNYFDIPTSKDTRKTKTSIDLTGGIGLSARYDFSDNKYVSVSSGYRMIVEKSNRFGYIDAGIGVGIKF